MLQYSVTTPPTAQHPHLIHYLPNAYPQPTNMNNDTYIILSITFCPTLAVLGSLLSVVAYIQGERARRQTTARIRGIETKLIYLIQEVIAVNDLALKSLAERERLCERSSRTSPTPSNLSDSTLIETSLSGDTLVHSESSDGEDDGPLVGRHHRPARIEFGEMDVLAEGSM
jgi:hypothetical protein